MTSQRTTTAKQASRAWPTAERRTGQRSSAKKHGVHYTPIELADFLARRGLRQLKSEQSRVLDPACGDGELLEAVARVARREGFGAPTLVGLDRDPDAIERARERLKSWDVSTILEQGDFLSDEWVPTSNQPSLLTGTSGLARYGEFDLVIANPPYVRTQVLGASKARQLAESFGLTGRTDLYQAFVCGMTACLREGGVLSLLCSNRFLSIQSGAALRRHLWTSYELLEIFDLGDTKFFQAAVLPTVVVARRASSHGKQECEMSRIYESENGLKATEASSLTSVLESDMEGHVKVDARTYEVERGWLTPLGASSEPWTLSNVARADWLATVDKHTIRTFGDAAKIRVGIKTTADRVFIRKDWTSLPEPLQPEDELLRTLITHHIADRWQVPADRSEVRVLYPHLDVEGRREPIELVEYPRAAAYLAENKDRLAGRKYVTESGRRWYEIWVPQNPGEWPMPKLVFPDISEMPRFFLDRSGAIVNGDCYWIPISNGLSEEEALIMLAVANSSFAVAFYDSVCTNRLYSGRRRFITQYVSRFPIPHLEGEMRRRVIDLTRALVDDLEPGTKEFGSTEAELDDLIWRSFGLEKEVLGKG